jgi:porin
MKFIAIALLSLLLINGRTSAADQWLLGDWGGKRTQLFEEGYNFNFTYNGQIATNLDGGYNQDRTLRYADSYSLGATLDLERLLGWENTVFRINSSGYNGKSLTRDRIQDPRQPSVTSATQEIYSSRQFWRLGSVWISKGSTDNKWNAKIGRIGEGEDFANPGCFFQNGAMCGTLIGNGINIWFNAPNAMWGARLRYSPSESLQYQYGIYQHNPRHLRSSNAFNLGVSGSEGAMHLMETHWKTTITENALRGNYWLGAYYNTSEHDDFYWDINHEPQAITGDPFLRHKNRHGIYFVMNQQVTAVAGSRERGLVLLFNVGINDNQVAMSDYQIQAGFKYKGPFAVRPKDDIGFGFSRVNINDARADYQRLVNQINQVVDYYDPNYSPVQHAEYAIELHYTYIASPAVTLRPNIQWLKDPGGVKEIETAKVFGLTMSVKF